MSREHKNSRLFFSLGTIFFVLVGGFAIAFRFIV
jgi:hypothetical protein